MICERLTRVSIVLFAAVLASCTAMPTKSTLFEKSNVFIDQPKVMALLSRTAYDDDIGHALKEQGFQLLRPSPLVTFSADAMKKFAKDTNARFGLIVQPGASGDYCMTGGAVELTKVVFDVVDLASDQIVASTQAGGWTFVYGLCGTKDTVVWQKYAKELSSFWQ